MGTIFHRHCKLHRHKLLGYNIRILGLLSLDILKSMYTVLYNRIYVGMSILLIGKNIPKKAQGLINHTTVYRIDMKFLFKCNT